MKCAQVQAQIGIENSGCQAHASNDQQHPAEDRADPRPPFQARLGDMADDRFVQAPTKELHCALIRVKIWFESSPARCGAIGTEE